MQSRCCCCLCRRRNERIAAFFAVLLLVFLTSHGGVSALAVPSATSSSVSHYPRGHSYATTNAGICSAARAPSSSSSSRGSIIKTAASSSDRAEDSSRAAAAAATAAGDDEIVSLEDEFVVAERQYALLDGAEWRSLVGSRLSPPWGGGGAARRGGRSSSGRSSGDFGLVSIAILRDRRDPDRRVVALGADNDDSGASVRVFRQSMAKIPDGKRKGGGVSNRDAASTMLNALVVAQTLAELRAQDAGIGGLEKGETTAAEEAAFPFHVLVWGGTERGQQLSKAFSALGCKVSLVTTTSNLKVPSVSVVPPSVGELEVPVCSSLSNFDAFVDTLGEENYVPEFINLLDDDSPYEEDLWDEDEDDDEDDEYAPFRGSVRRLLQQRHKCNVYMSTLPESQILVEKEGLLWGPRKADDYAKRQNQEQTSSIRKINSLFRPPAGLGATVQKLLEKGCTMATNPQMHQQLSSSNLFVRGWSLKDSWESTTWPRDSTTNVRYGLPTISDIMVDEDDDNDDDVDDDDDIGSSRSVRGKGNPYIVKISGVQGLQQQIVDKEETCLVFLKAPYCRTCRYLAPKYQRMARLNAEEKQQNNRRGIIFCEADTTGRIGKELGRTLEVESVPSFVLFRDGKRFGQPLGISRLPSKPLQKALELLRTGQPWDDSLLAGNKTTETRRKP